MTFTRVFEAIVMTFRFTRSNWRWLHDTCTHAAFHKALQNTLQQRLMILMLYCSEFIRL